MPVNETIKKLYLMQQFAKCNNPISSNERWLLQVK